MVYRKGGRMKELSLEKQIYLCKYHDIDTGLYGNLGITKAEAEELIQNYKARGLYEQYRNLREEDYEHIINKQPKRLRKEKTTDTQNKENRNKLLDLNDMLFEQLNTLMDDSLSESDLDKEIKVSKQVVSVSQTIINNANLLLQAKKHFDSTGTQNNEVASLLRLGE